MCKKIEQNRLFDLFNIKKYSDLVIALDNGAPSLIEYQVRDLINNFGEDSLLAHSKIQETIKSGDIEIHIDYNNEFYVNDFQKIDDSAIYTDSLF